jgi:ABC-type uncharacterized transport system substrate-binding protein
MKMARPGLRDLRLILMSVIVIMIAALSLSACSSGDTEQPPPVIEGAEQVQSSEGPPRKFKVLHIMSYHADWQWNVDQFNGFKDALDDLDVEYRVVEMDTKRHSSEEWIEKVSQEAKDLIDTWEPDLVYANDDAAQEYIVKDYINSDLPFVFSAVNADPETYGFVGSTNVTGVLEQEHFVQTVQLLRKLKPDIKRIAVIVDDSSTWLPVIERMQAKQDQLPEIEFISWDTILTFEEYKHKMTEYQITADAIGLIGIFHFKDENGENVPYQDVLRWTAENSTLPDFTYWKDRISYGTLCTVTVSGYEQGRAAGKIARGILLEDRSPSSYPMEPTVKGEPVISLARAKKLGLKIDSEILLAAEVIKGFMWEN